MEVPFLESFNFTGVIGKFLWMSSITFVISVVLLGIFLWFRNKSIYKTPISLVELLQNKTLKSRHDLFGKSVKNRQGTQDYVIKIPRQFKKKYLGYTPDFSFADSDGRLYFMPVGDGMLWQQLKRKVVVEKSFERDKPINEQELDKIKEHFTNLINEKYSEKSDIEKEEILRFSMESYMEENKPKETITYSLLSEPIPTDIKTVTINAIQAAENILEKNKLTAFGIGIAAFVIMLIAQIIFLWFTSK